MVELPKALLGNPMRLRKMQVLVEFHKQHRHLGAHKEQSQATG
jgi:hypothetical protein